MPTVIDSIVIQGTYGVAGGPFDGTLSNITGTNVMIFAMVSHRGVLSSQVSTCFYEDMGSSMSLGERRYQSLNGFARGSSEIWYKHIGNVVNKTETCRVAMSGDEGLYGVEFAITFVAVSGLADAAPTDVYDQGASTSAAASDWTSTDDFAMSVLTLGSSGVSPSSHADLDTISNFGRSGNSQIRHACANTNGTPSHNVDWDWSGASFTTVACGFDESVLVPPIITDVNSGASVSATDTNIDVDGTDFVPGATDFYLAETNVYADPNKELQSVSGITSIYLNWDAITLGTIPAGTRYVFAVTNPGTGSEQISDPFTITLTTPPAPIITDVDGGATADITDTNLAVNGSTLFTIGVTELWLAEDNNWLTTVKQIQNISAVTPPTLNWDDVNPGIIQPGARFLFALTDAGGGVEQVSNAFGLLLTAPPTPIIDQLDGQSAGVLFFLNATNLPVDGQDLLPAVGTELWLADGSDFQTAVKEQQTISGVTNIFLNWDAVTQGLLLPGLLYLFVVTQAGTAKERISAGFSCVGLEVLTPIITAVDGGSTVLETDVNLNVAGQYFLRPGDVEFWLADGTVFGTASKVLQGTSGIGFFSFTWPAVIRGGLAYGTLYLFYVTDASGPNRRESIAFEIELIESLIPHRIEQIGDGLGLVLAPIIDEDPIEPDKNVLVFRDHQCWTGLSKWWKGRDFEQWPSVSGDIVLKGQLDGVWTGTESVRINSVAVSDSDRMLTEENLDVFTGAGREVFTCGFWINKFDILTRGDVQSISIIQFDSTFIGCYLEIYAEDVAGDLFVGMAYDNGARTELLHTTKLEDVAGVGDWVFIQCEWKTTGDHMTLRQHGVELLSAAGSGPTVGNYTDTWIVHDFQLKAGPNTPDLMLRLQGLFYGLGPMALNDSNTLRDALTLTQYEANLKIEVLHLLHYYRMDDFIPDRHLHNHSKDLDPGRLVGGGVQRGLNFPPYGNYYRIFSGCSAICPVSDQANFNDWAATMSLHFRFLGAVGDLGLLFRLINTTTGASIEMNKIAAGAGPNELNGMLQFIARDNTGTPIVTRTINNPGLDPFDGSFQSFVITTSEVAGEWHFSIGDVGQAHGQTLNVSAVPPWHASPYDEYQVGGMFMDIHSLAYTSEVDWDGHYDYHVNWTTLDDVIAYIEDKDYDGFYWCQSPVAND